MPQKKSDFERKYPGTLNERQKQMVEDRESLRLERESNKDSLGYISPYRARLQKRIAASKASLHEREQHQAIRQRISENRTHREK